jgi:hypothetical protein
VKNNPILTVANVPPCETNFSFIIEPEGKACTFEQLYDLYAPPVYGWIQRFVPDKALADQILVNTFLNVWTNRHELQRSQVSPLLILIRISNKEIEKNIGKAVFQERLNIFLKGRMNVVLHEGAPLQN